MPDFRTPMREYIRAQALPVEKYSHQPRLYQLASELGQGLDYDDDILCAAAWLHDIGVFIGHRPEDLEALARWDNVAYAADVVPGLLAGWGFPSEKIATVVGAIATHLPHQQPTSLEGTLLHDADILEQLGAVGALRTICKIGRDTRFQTFQDALASLERAVTNLPSFILTEPARQLAAPRIATLTAFLAAAGSEAGNQPL